MLVFTEEAKERGIAFIEDPAKVRPFLEEHPEAKSILHFLDAYWQNVVRRATGHGERPDKESFDYELYMHVGWLVGILYAANGKQFPNIPEIDVDELVRFAWEEEGWKKVTMILERLSAISEDGEEFITIFRMAQLNNMFGPYTMIPSVFAAGLFLDALK